MRLELSAAELLELQRAAAPLPAEVESLNVVGDRLVLKVNPREHLPRFLQAVSPTVTLELQFERFEAGRAAFRVRTALKTLPLTALTQLLLKLVAVPALDGIEVESRGDELRLWVDLQRLIAERLPGLTLTAFALHEDRLFVEAAVAGLKPLGKAKENR